MFEKIVILLLFIISFIYVKYIVVEYKRNTSTNKKNIHNRLVYKKTLIMTYEIFHLKFLIKILIPYYILLILFSTIFWKTNNSDKIPVLLIMLSFLIIQIVVVLYVLKTKIVMFEDSFEYSSLFYTRKLEYKNLEIFFGKSNTYIYMNGKKVLRINDFFSNSLLLTRKIISINGTRCIRLKKRGM